MNSVHLIGNLTRDPELRTTQSGIACCTFSIAVSRPRTRDGLQEADFIPIVTWRNTAENCAKYLAKGRKVAVTGEIRTRNYEKDGHKVYVTEVLANSVEFLTPRNQQDSADFVADVTDVTGSQRANSQNFVEVDDDDLPF